MCRQVLQRSWDEQADREDEGGRAEPKAQLLRQMGRVDQTVHRVFQPDP